MPAIICSICKRSINTTKVITGVYTVSETDKRPVCVYCKIGFSEEAQKDVLDAAKEYLANEFRCCVCGLKCTGEFRVSASDPRPICSLCKADAAKGQELTMPLMNNEGRSFDKVPDAKFTFTHETLLTFMEGIMQLAIHQARRKNRDYASVVVSGTPDNGSTGLANFYETSRRCGGTPLHAVAVHRLKHELCIEKMLRGEEQESEPIVGRIIDAINYNVLALALYIETRQDMELLNKAADDMAAVGVTLGSVDYVTSK